MIGIIMSVYAGMLDHYRKKWESDKIDQKYQDWIRGEDMKKDLGYSEENFRRIPKRKIKTKAARKKHGY